MSRHHLSKFQKNYYDVANPSGFSSIVKLSEKSKNSKKLTKEWLSKQSTYTLHKPVRRRFETSKVVTSGISDQYQADLVEMRDFAGDNNGFNYILTVVDCFSRYAWMIPIQSKTANDVKTAFVELFKHAPFPRKLQTDQGLEFTNKIVQNYLKNNNIRFFTVKSQFKASLVERFNRTIKERMWRIFTKRGNHKWLNLIKSLTHAYNNSVHRVIGMKPVQVTKDNEMALWFKLYGNIDSSPAKAAFKMGDKVRLSKYKKVFEKGYLPNWTTEIFKINEILHHRRPIMYRIKDLGDENIEGSFYKQELQKVNDDIYPIKKIHKHRIKNGKKQILVEWIGYKNKKWINEDQLR